MFFPQSFIVCSLGCVFRILHPKFLLPGRRNYAAAFGAFVSTIAFGVSVAFASDDRAGQYSALLLDPHWLVRLVCDDAQKL